MIILKMYTFNDLIDDLKDWKRKRGSWITTSELVRYAIYRHGDISFWTVIKQFRKAIRKGIVIKKIDPKHWIYKYYITNMIYWIQEGTQGYTYSNTYNKYILSKYMTKGD